MEQEINVCILNWELYNPRNDIKNPTWFRFQNDFFDNTNFLSLTTEERLVWVYILCLRSKQRGLPQTADYFTVNMEVLHRATGICSTVCKSTIKKLQSKRIIAIRTYRGRYASVRDLYATEHNRTEQYSTERDGTERNKKTSQEGAEAPTLATGNKKTNPLNKATWEAYAKAYYERYKTEPVRNATVNAQVAQIVKRLGDEAPYVVNYFVGQDGFYASRLHAISLCLKDAEVLRTQWATGISAPKLTMSKNDALAENVRRQMEMIERGEL